MPEPPRRVPDKDIAQASQRSWPDRTSIVPLIGDASATLIDTSRAPQPRRFTLPATENDRLLKAIGSTSYARRDLHRLALQLEPLSRTLNTLAATGLTETMRQMQLQQAEANQLLRASLATNTDLQRTIRGLNQLSLQTSTLSATFARAHNSWIQEMRRAGLTSDHLGSLAKVALSNISYDLAVTADVLPKIDFNILAKNIGASLSTMATFQDSMLSLWHSYDGLVQSFHDIEHVVELPSFVLPGATHELSTTGYALDVLNPSDDRPETEDIDVEIYPVTERDSEDSVLIPLLERIGPEFVRMYKGAVTALYDNNPDRSRHVLTSLRELWDHLLRILAPQEEVRAWAAKLGNQGYLHNGQPTRRAKISYILRGMSIDPLRRFVEADTKAMIELYTLYGRLHGLDTGLTDEQLVAITVRSKSHLIYILQVREFSVD